MPPIPNSLKRKAAAMEPEEDENDKARKIKILQHMVTRPNRTAPRCFMFAIVLFPVLTSRIVSNYSMPYRRQDKIGSLSRPLRPFLLFNRRHHTILLHNLHRHHNHPVHLYPMVFNFNPPSSHRTTRRRRRESRKRLKHPLPPRPSFEQMGHKHLCPLPRQLINLLMHIRQPLPLHLHPHPTMYNHPCKFPFIQLYNLFQTLLFVYPRLCSQQHGIPNHLVLLLRHLFPRNKHNPNLSRNHHMYPLHRQPSLHR